MTVSLKAKAARATFWAAFRAGWSQIFGLITFTILVRFLGAKEYGLFALSLTLIELLRPLCTAGFSEAIQRENRPDEEVRDTVFWLSMGVSILVFIVVVLLASVYASFVREADILLPIIILASSLVISAIGRIHLAIQLKSYGHKSVTIQSIIAATIGGLFSVAMAVMGAGFWSLVVQLLVTEVLTAAFAVYVNRWLPRFAFDVELAKNLLGFSTGMMLTQVVWSGLVRVPDLVIGRFIGTEAVGVYRIAWRLVEMVSQTVLTPLASITFLVLARFQSEKPKFDAAYCRVIGLASIFGFPIILGFGLIAPELIPLVFGQNASQSVVIAQILSLSGPAFILNYFISSALGAKGHSQVMTKIALVQLVTTVLISFAAAPFGLVALTMAYVVRGYLTLPYQQLMLRRYGGIGIRSVVESVNPALISSIFMCFILLSLRNYGVLSSEPPAAQISAYIALGALSYMFILGTFARSSLANHYIFLKSIFREMRKSGE